MRTPNIPHKEINTTAREACSQVRTFTEPPESSSSSSWSSWCSCFSWWSWWLSSSGWLGWKILSMLYVLFIGLEVISWLFTDRIKEKPTEVQKNNIDTSTFYITFSYLSMQILSVKSNFQSFLSPAPRTAPHLPPLLRLVTNCLILKYEIWNLGSVYDKSSFINRLLILISFDSLWVLKRLFTGFWWIITEQISKTKKHLRLYPVFVRSI